MNVKSARQSPASSEWNYVIATVAAFVFTPELRRLVDWRGNFDPLNAFAVIPLLMLCPIAVLAFRRRERLRNKGFLFVTLCWAAAFGYATFIAAMHGAIVQALYAVGQFCLPIAVGAWLITRTETMEVAHARLARALLIFGAIAAAYGIIQYVVAPPWDTTWMQNIDAQSFGKPERFGIRVFGVLNGPGVFALFLGAVILFNLPYLRVRNWLNVVSLLVMIVALMLSLVRTAWLAVFVGIVIFIWLSPKRLQALQSIVSVTVLCGVGVLGVLLISPNASIGDQVTQRFTSLSNVQDDGSAAERRQTADATFETALGQPVGAGLGLTGGGSKLAGGDAGIFSGAPSGAIDNGFVSRFFEMGIPGFVAFLIACCASIAFAARAYAQFAKERYQQGMIIGASCIAALVVIFAVNASGDDQQALLGVLFFAALALPLMPSTQRSINVPIGQVITVPARRKSSINVRGTFSAVNASTRKFR